MKQKTVLRELSVSDKEKIYRQHLGLVVDIAKKYVGKSPDFGFEDLISAGVLGLFRAAEKFDERKGCKFSTYATRWIKQSINRALDEGGRTIRISLNMIENLSKYRKVRKKLWQELNREPLIEEIAAAMKITIDRTWQIRKCLENPSKIISLERFWDKDENSILSEFLEDKKVISPVALASGNILKEHLQRILTIREEKIIKLRFGLEDGINHTLEEVGREMGLSKEIIRRIVKKALAKLKRIEERGLKEES